jgi:hypothetical protein
MKSFIFWTLCALFVGVGCEGEGSQAQWDALMRDARGDNMQMHNDFATGNSSSPSGSSPRSSSN